MSIEAMKQALEALETNNKAWKALADSGDAGWWEAEEQPFYEISIKSITALRQAIEQAEQAQPVAWSDPSEPDSRYAFSWSWSGAGRHHSHIQPLYTTPPQRKPLTDEEICRIKAQIKGTLDVQFVVFARAIEAAHGIKGKA